MCALTHMHEKKRVEQKLAHQEHKSRSLKRMAVLIRLDLESINNVIIQWWFQYPMSAIGCKDIVDGFITKAT